MKQLAGMAAKALNLDGDDALDLEEALETTFGFILTQAEGAACVAAGDVHALVLRKLSGRGGESCASSMAFYRLRRVLADEGFSRAELRPDTSLKVVAKGKPATFLRRLRKATGLQVPSGYGGLVTSVTWFVWLSVGASVLAALSGFTAAKVGVAASLIGFGALLAALDPGRFPAGCTTLGDLARRVVALNHARFVNEGAAVREPDVWDAVAELLSEYSGEPSSQISPATWLFGPPKAA